MKLIKPKAELLLQQPGLEGIYKQIELAGRTCYKSTDKITGDSAKPFVDRMINSNHLAMLEHGTVYLAIPITTNHAGFSENHYRNNPYSKFKESYGLCMKDEYGDKCDCWCITTNLRVLVENGWLDDLQYICEPTEYHEKRYTFKLTTSIGVTRELNRHRVNSIAEQSTRYCNYAKDKFGGEITFCIPSWLNLKEGSYTWDKYFGDWRWIDTSSPIEDQFVAQCFYAEKQYMDLIGKNWQPQQAREVLPLCTATEIIHTAFASDWKHFFDLRYFGKTGAPHPNIVELAGLMAKEADKHGIWNELCNENIEKC